MTDYDATSRLVQGYRELNNKIAKARRRLNLMNNTTDYDSTLIPPTHADDISRPRKGTVTVTLEYDFDAEGSVQDVTESEIASAMHKCRCTGYTERSATIGFWEE